MEFMFDKMFRDFVWASANARLRNCWMQLNFPMWKKRLAVTNWKQCFYMTIVMNCLLIQAFVSCGKLRPDNMHEIFQFRRCEPHVSQHHVFMAGLNCQDLENIMSKNIQQIIRQDAERRTSTTRILWLGLPRPKTTFGELAGPQGSRINWSNLLKSVRHVFLVKFWFPGMLMESLKNRQRTHTSDFPLHFEPLVGPRASTDLCVSSLHQETGHANLLCFVSTAYNLTHGCECHDWSLTYLFIFEVHVA